MEMCVCPLRAEKPGLHPNLTCVHGDRGCRNPIPGDVAETRGFAKKKVLLLSTPKKYFFVRVKCEFFILPDKFFLVCITKKNGHRVG